MTDYQDDLFGDIAPEPVRMITVKQPWAWAIIFAGKDVENRPRYLSYRGRLLIHSGKTTDPAGAAFLESLGIEIPPDLPAGQIIGSVNLTDCIRNSPSRWARPDAWHNVLTSPMAATHPLPARGQLSLVTPPNDWETAFSA